MADRDRGEEGNGGEYSNADRAYMLKGNMWYFWSSGIYVLVEKSVFRW